MTDLQERETIAPCPFCGSDEIMRFCDPTEAPDNSVPSRRLQCAGCHIEAPFYDTEAEAIAAWNTRSNPRPQAGREGWKLVPVEPTEAMLEAAHRQIDWCRNEQNTRTIDHPSQSDGGGTNCRKDLQDAWSEALAASPTPPTAQPGDVERLRSELRAALERLEQFIKLDDRDRHTADNEEDRQFFVGRANGLRTAVNYIRGCGAIDCVNACDGDFTHETCPSARAALTPSESGEAGT